MFRFAVLCTSVAAYQLPTTVAPAAHVRASPIKALLTIGDDAPKVVGDAKIAFQAAYGRPVGGVQQGFVNEMLTSVTLAPASTYNGVFSVGFEGLCTTFLEGVASENDRMRLKNAMCAGVGFDPAEVKKEADALEAFAQGKTEDELFENADFQQMAAAGNFKYSYPLGAGLLMLMPMVGAEPSDEVIERWCTKLGLPTARLQKDWAFYKGALAVRTSSSPTLPRVLVPILVPIPVSMLTRMTRPRRPSLSQTRRRSSSR